MPVDINALWIGPRMGPVHAACLRSFLRHGHRVILHAYEAVEDVPAGVEFFDARSLMSEDLIVKHKRHGSLALASDRYRYRILRAGMGLYVDCDVYCVRPLDPRPYTLGWASNKHVGSAVLGAPPDSQLVEELCSAADNRDYIPPWDPLPKRVFHRAMKALGKPVTVDRQRWGTIGPKLVTHMVSRLGLLTHVTEQDVYSPVTSKTHSVLFEPGVTLASIVKETTLAIHLQNEMIRRRANGDVPRNSPLGEILAS